MTSRAYVLLLCGMMLGTYLPRTLPLLLSGERPLPMWLERWLKLVPYGALGALIFPGILLVDPEHPWIGMVGGLVAVLVSWKWNNLVLTIVMAFAVVTILR
ncbi:MAG: AzlD domain-containing protein [Firmicutes bacterium]|nr:AzlD domain-containing protein [Bacillota bacterium]